MKRLVEITVIFAAVCLGLAFAAQVYIEVLQAMNFEIVDVNATQERG